jgi:hypothetical protein
MDCFVASLLAMTPLDLQLTPRHPPIRFEDAHEAIADPTIRVAFVRDGVA